MPTISEDGSSDRDSIYSGDNSNFEQLMVNMLDERDKLMEMLRETRENLAETQSKLQESERDRENCQKQLSATQPQVNDQLSPIQNLFQCNCFLKYIQLPVLIYPIILSSSLQCSLAKIVIVGTLFPTLPSTPSPPSPEQLGGKLPKGPSRVWDGAPAANDFGIFQCTR